MDIKIIEINPDVATRLLQNNLGNRRLSPTLTNKFAEDMRRGKWDLNGETIKLCNTTEERYPPLWVHKLLDGQHRLSACVKARKPFKTAVAFVKNPKVFGTIDCGKSRSPGDICTILGHRHASQLAATLKLQVQVETNKLVDTMVGSGATADVKNYQIEAELAKRPNLIESVEFAHRMKSKLKTRPACMGVAHYNICKIDKELGEECLTLFHTGEGLRSGDAIYAYRSFLIPWMQNENNKLTSHYLLKGLYIMWNNWFSGKTITRVRVPKTGPLPRLKNYGKIR